MTRSLNLLGLLPLVFSVLVKAQNDKPGYCPTARPPNGAFVCTSDQGCSGSQKCCQAGSTTYSYCATPVFGTNPWISKPGTCPASFSPGNPCTADGQCPSAQKCCQYSSLGQYCASPISGNTGNGNGGTNKPGTCPSITAETGVCRNDCSGDYSCYGSQRCCPTNCGRICAYPTSGNSGGSTGPKPGRCVVGRFQGGCSTTCRSDSGCSGTQKCCNNGCASVCALPGYVG